MMNTYFCKQTIATTCLAIGTAASFSLTTNVCFAQQSDPFVEREAQTLLESAAKLMAAKEFPAACRKLESILQKLPQATGARLELAYCYRGEGRMASSWRQFIQVENNARVAGHTARVAEARRNVAELAPIMAKLQLNVPPEVSAIADVTITLDGQEQLPASWGTPIPVDAMEHSITATARGYEPWSTRIHVTNNSRTDGTAAPIVVNVGSPSLPGTSLQLDVALEITKIPGLTIKLDGASVYLSEWADGGFIGAGSHELHVAAPEYEPWTKQIVVRQGERVLLAVPRLQKKQQPPTPQIQVLKSTVAPQQPAVSDGRVAGIFGAVLGGASLGAGAILGGMAISRIRESGNGHCDANNSCDAKGNALRAEADTLSRASTATFIAGGILVATGIVLIAISSKPSVTMGNPATAATKVWIGPTSIGLESSW